MLSNSWKGAIILSQDFHQQLNVISISIRSCGNNPSSIDCEFFKNFSIVWKSKLIVYDPDHSSQSWGTRVHSDICYISGI